MTARRLWIGERVSACSLDSDEISVFRPMLVPPAEIIKRFNARFPTDDSITRDALLIFVSVA